MSEPKLLPEPALDETRVEPPIPEQDHAQQVAPVMQVPVGGLSVPGRIDANDPRRELLSEHLRGPQRETKAELGALRARQRVSPVKKGPQAKFPKFVQEHTQRGPDYDPLGPVKAERERREAKAKLDTLQPTLAQEIKAAREAGGTDPDLIELDARTATQDWVVALTALEGIQTRSIAALAGAQAGLRGVNPGVKRITAAAKCHQPPQLEESKKAAWTAYQGKNWLTVGTLADALERLVLQAVGFIDRVAEVRRRMGSLKAPGQIASMTKFLDAHEALGWQTVVDTERDVTRESSLAHLEDQIERFEKPFGDRVQAQGAAQKLATDISTTEHDVEVDRAENEHDTGVAAVPEVKIRPKKKHEPKGPTKKEQTALDSRQSKLDTLDEQLSTAKTNAGAERARRDTSIFGSFAAVANSASGKTLDDGVLTWVINTSGGKPAVAQSLADVAAAGGSPLAMSVAKQDNVTAVANACVELLGSKFPVEHVVPAALLLLKSKAVVQPWLLALEAEAIASALEFAGDHPAALRIVVKVQPVLGTSGETGDLVDVLQKTKAADADLDWLLTLAGNPGAGFGVLCRAIRNYDLPLTAVRALHHAAGNRFTLAEVASMVNDHRANLAAATAAVVEADAHAVSYVDLVAGVGGTLPPMLKAALRAESLLRDAARCPAGFSARASRADRHYVGGAAYQQANQLNDARTGFITLAFPTGATVEVHTHWNSKNKSVGRISSMHVQEATADGTTKNGIELDDWKQLFKRLPQAVVDGHNAATGIRCPTGGPLSLP